MPTTARKMRGSNTSAAARMIEVKTRHCLSDTEPLIMSTVSIDSTAHPTSTENKNATASSSNRMSLRIRQAFSASGSAGTTSNQFAAL